MLNRISLTQVFSQGLRGILNVQSEVAKTQQQVASGKRVLTPADDPVAAARILQLESEQARVGQYQKNIDGATTSLELEDTQLDTVTNLLTRVRELTVQAGDGGYTKAQREALAQELATRLDELGSLANTRSPSGEYIFGGYKGEQAPFVKAGNDYTYRGDDGQRLLQVASSTQVAVNDSGNSIFMAIPSVRLAGTAAAGNTGTGTISSGQVVDQTTFNASFSGSYTINFTSPTTYDIVPTAGGPAVVTGATFTSGTDITLNGASFRIVGAPATGDSYQIDPPATQSIFTTIGKLVTGLRNYTDSADDKLRLQDLVSESLDNLNGAEENISVVRSRIGARLNTLESTSSLHQGTDLVTQKVLADVRDLDYTQAITQLTQQNFVLQAAQQSFAKISGLSLFDFLR
jgi:flagellar hook-associated protein 3 FlgL